jgi:hypothetical protein
MSKKLLALFGFILWLGGCAPGIQFSEVSPKIDQYHPKSVVILPFTNTVGMEVANDQTNEKMVKALTDSNMFDRVIPPDAVKALMLRDNRVIDVITRYRSVWAATGTADPKISAWIGKAFGADSIVFGEVTAWSETANISNHIYDAGLALRWVDAGSGEVLWKASEGLEFVAGNPCIFDCSSAGKTMDLCLKVVMDNWPGAKK